jgi:hypothetical protein
MPKSEDEATFTVLIEQYNGREPIVFHTYLKGLSVEEVAWICSKFAIACGSELNSSEEEIPHEFVQAKSPEFMPDRVCWSQIYELHFTHSTSGNDFSMKRGLPNGMTSLYEESEYEFHFDNN